MASSAAKLRRRWGLFSLDACSLIGGSSPTKIWGVSCAPPWTPVDKVAFTHKAYRYHQ